MIYYNFSTIDDQIEVLEEYLKVKLEQRDWHGVRDCCVDIEILEAIRKERQ